MTHTYYRTCPYCGSNIVLSDKIEGELTPDGVIPFAITPKQLPAAVRSFYKNKKLLPRNFFSDSSIGTVQGVYVPFWLYDSNPAGEVVFNGSLDRTYRDGDYVRGLIAFPMGFLFIVRFIKDIKAKKGLKSFGQLASFGVIAAPLGLWYSIRNLIRYNTP